MKFDPDKHKAFSTFEDACAAQNHSDLCKDTPTKIEIRRAKRARRESLQVISVPEIELS
jgi:hypothetical protein